jgi:DNA invertase Pin-like site-specific DNA recombinase
MTIRTAIYARTSPDCRLSAEDQVEHLTTIANARGWTVTNVFRDRPASVRKGLDRRPGEMALIEAIRSRTIDRVTLWSIDRIGRSLVELVAFLDLCRAANVSVFMHEQGVDSAASNGLPLFDMTAMLAFHVRQMRRDRILRGQAAARSLSIRFGRPPIAAAKLEKAKQELVSGKGVRQVVRLAGISAASVSRLKNSIGATADQHPGRRPGPYAIGQHGLPCSPDTAR